jgi:hypothetical protein
MIDFWQCATSLDSEGPINQQWNSMDAFPNSQAIGNAQKQLVHGHCYWA